MISLSLDQKWDLALTPSGSLPTAEGGARAAQDVSTACRTFRGECWFDTARGIPYLGQIFGGTPPDVVIRQYLETEAATQAEVAAAAATLVGFDGRGLSGRIRVTTDEGEVVDVVL